MSIPHKNKNKIILDLCGGTGSWSKPYKDAGYDVRVITLPEYDLRKVSFDSVGRRFYFFVSSERDTPIKILKTAQVGFSTVGLIKQIIPASNIYGILAAPPCTMFSLARTKAKTPRDLKQGMETVRTCMNIIWTCRENTKLAFWALENPMGYLRQFLGNPRFSFDPSEFGADYNKTTDVWGYFNEPKRGKKKRYDSTDDNTRKLPEIPGEYKMDKNMTPLQVKRSITPKGFAEAFFKANQ